MSYGNPVRVTPPAQTTLLYSTSQYAIRSICYWGGQNHAEGWRCVNSDLLQKSGVKVIENRNVPEPTDTNQRYETACQLSGGLSLLYLNVTKRKVSCTEGGSYSSLLAPTRQHFQSSVISAAGLQRHPLRRNLRLACPPLKSPQTRYAHLHHSPS